jgi:hypothetical protein
MMFIVSPPRTIRLCRLSIADDELRVPISTATCRR